MQQTIAVVTFYSRGGSTERLATAAAVGAVQMRAGIRMRRVPDPDPAGVLDLFPAHRDSLQRMHKEYIPPREADVLAAHVLVLATPPDVDAAADEWAGFLNLLTTLASEGRLDGKVAAVVDNGPAAASLRAAASRLGLLLVQPAAGEGDAVARATALGRAAVSRGRTRAAAG